MNSLPPTVPSNNKVKIRNKTASFKRPFSCDANETNKKEGKSRFFNLNKGSSNSKLNEDVENHDEVDNHSSTNNIVHEEKVLGCRIQGRNFDSDDELEMINEETSVTKMDKLFSDCNKVVNNPALIGYLLKYLTSHNMDYNDLLYYLVVQHYKATVVLKEFSKDAARFANEIITTFILEKSNLKIEHKVDTLTMLDNLKSNIDLLTIFDKSADDIFNHCIKTDIDRIRQSIKHGLFTLEVSVVSFNFDSKMNFFNDCIKTIVKNLLDKMPKESTNTVTKEIKEKEQYMLDIITGVKTALATIYYYYTKKEKDDNADSVSLISNRHLRTSFLMKSTESLQIMTNCVLDKQPIFCSKINKKSTSHSFFRKGKSNKGHSFQDKIFDYPVDCLLCQKLLWGINPQGLCCSHCQEAVHRDCKDHVRTNCYKESKRFLRNTSNVTQPSDDDNNKIGCGDDDSVSITSQISNYNYNDVKDFHDISKDVELNNVVEVDNISDKLMTSSVTSEISQSVKPNYVVSTATICVTTNDDIPSLHQDNESIDSVSEINNDRQQDMERKIDVHNEDRNYSSLRLIPPGNVRDIARKYDQKNISRSQSLRKTILKFGDDNIENKTLPRSSKRGSEAVYVQDLVADSTAWANDPDMNVEESFEANKELEFFTYHLTKEEDKAEYTRLLVLMEFHHKIKFTVMTLKRFDYLLIRQWPNDDSLLFKTLSLNSIIPLYELIKTLDATIELCKMTNSYSKDMAQNVHNWLVSDEESNMEMWLKYSIDICCTNSLNLVKNTWKESYRTDAKFSKVLNKRHNKMIMVEQLSNMRPLLFNLPLIVCKIFKDLNKFSKFKEETKLWKEIHEKFKKLPTYIDEHCMPLVQLINNGTIVNNLDRSSWFARLNSSDPSFDYILDFPKTAFHHKLFDFQELKISSFRESNVKNKTPAVFVKDISDVYAICYDNMLVLLQKENEKYHLKQFKAADTSKMNPILMLDNVHASEGETKGSLYGLALIFINVAVLAQVWFQKQDVRKRWKLFFNELKIKTVKNKVEMESFENTTDKYSDIKVKVQEFSQSQLSLFKEENKLDELEDTSVLFPIPNSANECLVGTSFDAVNILKTCYENLSVPLNDDVLHNLLSKLTTMENRISHYQNSRSMEVLNADEIECEISDMLRDEQLDESLSITPPETIEYGDESGCDFEFRDMTNSQTNDNHEYIKDDDISTEMNKMSDDAELNNDDDDDNYMRQFVDEYVTKIIEEAQIELTMGSSYETESGDHDNDHSLIQMSSVITEASTA